MGNGKATIREKVHAKLNGHCAYCSDAISVQKTTLDHVFPKCLGGENDIKNYLPSCDSCNRLKAHKNLDEFKEEAMNEIIKVIHKSKYLNIALKLDLIKINPDFKFLYESDIDLDQLEVDSSYIRVLKHDINLLRKQVDVVKDEQIRELIEENARLKRSFHDEMTKDKVYARQKLEIETLRDELRQIKETVYNSYNTYIIMQVKEIARKFGDLQKVIKTKIIG